VNPLHHPTEAVLTDYASGAMRPAFAVTAAAHIEGCPQCRARVALLERLGGELIADLPEAEMAAGSLEDAMARLDAVAPRADAAPRGPVVERIRFGHKRHVKPGVWVRHADPAVAGGDLLYMLRIPKGTIAAPHGHGGQEFTAILKGAYRDEHGLFAAGDFAEFIDGDEHRPAVEGDDECICLIASERPMRMKSMMGRLVQVLTGT
jgi:putative transcriptional regulator